MRYIGLLLWANLLGTTAAAQDVALPVEIGVERPFGTTEAIQKFREFLENEARLQGLDYEVPVGMWEVLPAIHYWGYSFQNSDGVSYTAHFKQYYSADYIVQNINAAVQQLKQDGCSYMNVGQISYVVNAKQISFSAPLSGKQRTCADIPLLGEVKTDIADIGGSASGTFGFRVVDATETDKFRGKAEPTDVTATANAKATGLFGIDFDSVAGQLLKAIVDIGSSPFSMATTLGVPGWALMHEIDKGLQARGGSVGHASQYLMSGGGEVAEREYLQFIADLNDMIWSEQKYWQMSEAFTRFDNSSGLKIQIVFEAPIADEFGLKIGVADASEEIRLLRSFSEPSMDVVVQKGDSWSKLAREHYGSEFLQHALRASQPAPLMSARLRPGQHVTIPPFYKLTMIENHYVVRPGDTLIELCSRWYKEGDEGCLARLRSLNPGLRDRRIPALSVIRVASGSEEKTMKELYS